MSLRLVHPIALASFLLLGSGCFTGGTSADEANEGGGAGGGGGAGAEDPSAPDDGASGGLGGECEIAEDCALAASTCCECPSFAVPAGDSFKSGCEDVECEPNQGCSAVEAVCDQGQCVMVCSPLVTEKVCEFGFIQDLNGCLLDECADEGDNVSAECSADAECVQVPEDCCGCAAGGSDTAVPASVADAFRNSLDCPDAPACPDIDVCEPSLVPRCLAGRCALGPSASPSPEEEAEILCGAPELPACPSGFQCVLNSASDQNATELGVGKCEAE